MNYGRMRENSGSHYKMQMRSKHTIAGAAVRRSGSKFEVIERVAAQINAPWKIVSNDQRTSSGHANGSMDGRGTNEAEVVTRPRLPPGLAGGRITETRKKDQG